MGGDTLAAATRDELMACVAFSQKSGGGDCSADFADTRKSTSE